MNNQKNLVELTEDEFVKNIFSVMDTYDEQISALLKDKDAFFKLYRNFLLEKNNHDKDLKFYLQDDVRLFYKVFKKERIGFKYKKSEGE